MLVQSLIEGVANHAVEIGITLIAIGAFVQRLRALEKAAESHAGISGESRDELKQISAYLKAHIKESEREHTRLEREDERQDVRIREIEMKCPAFKTGGKS